MISFIGVGCERCATTWVAKCLSRSPQVEFSKPKELRFWDKIYNGKNIKEYEVNFKSNNLIKGEFSPAYYKHEQIAKDIRRHYPNVKIIVCLREPGSRLKSFVRYKKAKGDFLKDKPRELMYLYDVFKFTRHFTPENIHFIYFDDVVGRPHFVIKNLCYFLGIPYRASMVIPQKINEAPQRKYVWLFKIYYFLVGIKNILPFNRTITCWWRKIGMGKVIMKAMSWAERK